MFGLNSITKASKASNIASILRKAQQQNASRFLFIGPRADSTLSNKTQLENNNRNSIFDIEYRNSTSRTLFLAPGNDSALKLYLQVHKGQTQPTSTSNPNNITHSRQYTTEAEAVAKMDKKQNFFWRFLDVSLSNTYQLSLNTIILQKLSSADYPRYSTNWWTDKFLIFLAFGVTGSLSAYFVRPLMKNLLELEGTFYYYHNK
jgi:hypothetical protein